MNSAKSWLLEQFPDYENVIQQLWGVDKGFEAKSHELQELQLRLDRLNPDADPTEPDEVERLQSRRAALQNEIMFLMGANKR
jgi:uncharacterized protein YdcH (DUF465 family)